jgi:PKD repeat protein
LSSTTVSNPTATPTATTTYSVTATDANGCTGSNTVTITVSPTITLAMAGFAETCPGACDGQAVCIPNGGMGGPYFLWSNAGTAASVSPVCPGTYTVVVTDGVGCTATGTATVGAQTPFNLTSTTTPSNCNLSNGSATLNATGGTPNYSYVWNPGGQTTQTATGLIGGNYTVTLTDANGCTSSLTVTVPSNPAVIASIPSFSNVTCFVACDGTANSQASSGTAPYTYAWSNGQTTQNASGLCPGTYTITITDNIGCTSTATITITQPNQLTVATAVSGPICIGANATITGTPNGGTGPYTYVWAPSGGNASSATVSPTTTTTYTVTVTDANNCTAFNMITVVVNPLPVVNFTGIDTVGCVPLLVTFTNNTVSSANCSWTFGDNGTSSSCGNPVTYTYNTPGVYSVTLTVTDNNGCVNSSTHNNMVTVYGYPVSCFSFGPQPTTVLNPTISFADCSTGASSWQWSFGDVANSSSTLQNPTFMYPDTGMFVVQQKVCNANGCCDSSQQTVIIGPDFTFYVPNAFTPGSATPTNNEFFPVGTGLDLNTYHMWVWDRWGNLIFETDNWNRHWDGKVAGGNDIVQQDVYVWKIRINDYSNAKHEYVGHVSVIR